MEAACCFETSLNFYQTTQRYIPQDVPHTCMLIKAVFTDSPRQGWSTFQSRGPGAVPSRSDLYIAVNYTGCFKKSFKTLKAYIIYSEDMCSA
jgi:hypothetical protein